MATLKQRLNSKNVSGAYDTIHLETSSDLVKRSDGSTIEATLANLTAEMNGKASTNHTHTVEQVGAAAASHIHTKSQITDFPSSMPASDVYNWAKQPSKPSYTASEVGAMTQVQGDIRYLKLSGGDMTGMLDMNNYALTGIPKPVLPTDAVNYQSMMDIITSFLDGIKTTVIIYSTDGSSNITTPITLTKSRTIGDFFIFNIPFKTIKGENSYDRIRIKYPNGFGFPGGGWSELGNEGPQCQYGNTAYHSAAFLYPDSDGYTAQFSSAIYNGAFSISGNLIAKVG